VLAPRIENKFIREQVIKEAEEKSNIKMMPNRTLDSFPKLIDGLLLFGDTLNSRHPLTGGAQSVIFSDCVLLKKLLSKEKNVVDFKNYNEMFEVKKKFLKERIPYASTTNILANCLYMIFSEKPMYYLRKACFSYFTLGGMIYFNKAFYIKGPIDFLSVLDPRPLFLLYHFFSVGFYGSYLLLFSSKNFIMNSYHSCRCLFIASKLVIPQIYNNIIKIFIKN
jgi:squalene monooxygenase